MTPLEIGIRYLLEKQPYYAHLIHQMRRIPVSGKGKDGKEKIKTAGVSVTGGNINLYYNTEFFETVLRNEGAEGVAGVLKHESQHVTHLHLLGRNKGKYKKTFNLAADASINQYNEMITKSGLKKSMSEIFGPTPDGESNGIVDLEAVRKLAKNKDLKAFERLEYYYDALIEEFSKNKDGDGEPDQMEGDGPSGSGSFDDHDIWEESDCTEEVVKEILKNAVEKAVNKTGRGTCPSEVLLALAEMNKNRVNWKGQLKNFIARQVDVMVQADRRKRHRRYGVLYPGARKKFKLHLVFIKDTSGSVWDEALAACDAEIRKIHKLGAKISVIDADADVQQVYKYSPHKSRGNKGRGGTTFSPALKRAEQEKADAIIYFTDGYGESEIYKPKGIPVLWALCTEDGVKHLPESYKKILVIP